MLAVGLVSAVVAAAPSPAAPAAPTTRLSGADRYDTAAAVSRATFTPGVSVAYAATGERFPDALAGGAVAGMQGAPILLVTHDAVPAPTSTELDRLHPGRIVLLGGTSAVSPSVEAELGKHTAGGVTRIVGNDRFGTAAAVSAAGFPGGASTAYIANGDGFADALAGGAAAASAGGPVLLVQRDAIPSATADELRRLHPGSLVVLGGTAAVSQAVEDQLHQFTGGAVSRAGGSDRYGTAAAVSNGAFPAGVPVAVLATGASFADALAATPAAAAGQGPVLLVTQTCIPGAVADELTRLAPQKLVIVGGTSAVGPGVENGDRCPGSTPPPPAVCGTTPTPPATYEHVVIVMFENKHYSDVIGSPAAPYATQLAGACASSPNWTDAGSEFPSLPNYIALTSGETPIVTDCSPGIACQSMSDNLFRQVRAAGGTAQSFESGMTSNCELANDGRYAVRHNPAAYYVGGDDRAACQRDDLPFEQLDPDHLPTLAFVTPDLDEDTHDAAVAVGDQWAKTHIAAILNGADYRAGHTALLWLWDEDTPIPNVVVAPSVKPGTKVPAASHYGALRAVEEMLGLPLLGSAQTATSIRGPFNL